MILINKPHSLTVTTMRLFNPVVSRASAHGRSYLNVDFHRTGRLLCVKIEVGRVNALASARACMLSSLASHTYFSRIDY